MRDFWRIFLFSSLVVCLEQKRANGTLGSHQRDQLVALGANLMQQKKDVPAPSDKVRLKIMLNSEQTGV